MPGNSKNKRANISVRSVFIGLGLVIFLSAITPYVEMVIAGTQIGSICPPAGAFFLLVCLALGVNPLLRRLRRGNSLELRQGELITIYSLLICTASISSVQFVQFLVPMITGVFYYATPENGWAETIQPLIPDWFSPRSSEAIKALYEGLPGHLGAPWKTWIRPFLFWAPLLMAFYCVMICICAILRKQWIERERLAFPLVQVPLEMTETTEVAGSRIIGTFFRNKLMWIGFMIPVILHSLDGLHQYFPGVPRLHLRRINIGAYFVGKPWNAVNPFFFSIYFSVIGFAYLLSLELSFSFWFFFILLKAEEIRLPRETLSRVLGTAYILFTRIIFGNVQTLV